MEFPEYDFISITEYGWEDISIKSAKIYLTKNMEGIKLIDPSQIQCDFESMSIDLKIRDFKGKNWRFRIDPLFDVLAVEACSVNIKSNSITITLNKQNSKNWSSLKWIKQVKKEAMPGMKKAEQEGEPETLMTLMKDLYNNGSDDIKKTISESWAKSQD